MFIAFIFYLRFFFSNSKLNSSYYFYQTNQEQSLKPIFDSHTQLHDNFFNNLFHLFRIDGDIKLTAILTRGTIFSGSKPKSSQYVAQNLVKGARLVISDLQNELIWWRVNKSTKSEIQTKLLYF